MTAIDPIFVAVLQRRLKSITEEIGLTLLRTSRSPILSEARDFATGLYDAKGRMLEQTEYIPVLAFALQPACQAIIAAFGDDVHPGDVFIHNDVFTGGNQNNDVAVFRPIFHEGVLVAWSAVKGHQADIGGAVRGGYNPEAREIWQEALRLPPLRIYSRGKRCEDVWQMIFANIRLKIVEEDIKAQIGGTTVGERSLLDFIAQHGRDKILTHIDQLFTSTERMMRREIEAIPDGVYHGESTAFYDGVRPGSRMEINLAVTVKGSDISFDFTGSSPQTPGFVNAPYSATASALILTFLMLVNPEIPHNAGLLRPLNIVNPEGSFLNASYPAATTFGNSLTGPTSDAIFRAFSQALPQMVTAGWNRMLGLTLAGHDPRRKAPYVDIMFVALKGGSGATFGCDGYDHIGLINCGGGLMAQDYEMMEIQDPHFLIKHEYAEDSAGAGEWRGGLGVETIYRLDGIDTTGIVFGDGIEEEARGFGLFGGKSGALNSIEIDQGGEVYRPRSKEIVRNIKQGTIMRHIAGGGGGYGHPHRRSVEKVVQDLRSGVISERVAREDYGVVVDPVSFVVDQEATAQLRGAVA